MNSRPDSAAISTTPRYQLRLFELSRWVLAAGVPRGALVKDSAWRMFEPGRWAGLVLLTLAVGLMLSLVQSIARGLASKPIAAAGSWAFRAWALGWRVVAALIILAGISEQRQILQPRPASPRPFVTEEESPFCSLIEPMRVELYPISLALVLGGVLLGLSTGTRASSRKPGNRAIFVILAAIGGLFLAANLDVVSYLALIAIEHVSNAEPHPTLADRVRPGLLMRLDQAGLVAAAGALILLFAALLLARDFRQGAVESKVTPAWVVARVLAMTAAIAVGLELAFVEVSRLEPRITDGFAEVLGSKEMAAILLVSSRSPPAWPRERSILRNPPRTNPATDLTGLRSWRPGLSAPFCFRSRTSVRPRSGPPCRRSLGTTRPGPTVGWQRP